MVFVCIYAIYKSGCFHNVEAILSDILDLKIFSHGIKLTNYFLKTLFIKEPSCSFEGGETTEY